MNGVMEMVSEVRRTLILCTAISLCGCSDFFRWSAVDSTYFLQTDFWSGMISGMRASRTDRDLATRQCRYAEPPGQILPGRPRSYRMISLEKQNATRGV